MVPGVQSITKYVAVSFTIKNQPFSSLLPALEQISKDHPGAVLIHGFLPRAVVAEKGFSMEVVDALDELFPKQENFFGRRPEMAGFARRNGATVYIVGNVIEGVQEEVDLYRKTNIEDIRFVPAQQ